MPNSPPTDSTIAVLTALKGGSPHNRPTSVISRNLPTVITTRMPRISARSSCRTRRSSIMPTEMKNSPSRMSRNGRMAASTWCRYSVSASITPARNAPVAIETPAAWDTHAEPSTTNNTASVKSSCRRLWAISWKSGRSAKRPASSTNPTAKVPTATAVPIRTALKSRLPAAKAPANTRNGTNARSWNSSTLKATRPCVRLISDCSVSCWTRIAVELTATAPPSAAAASRSTPKAWNASEAHPATSSICTLPTPNTSRRIATMRGQENSKPRVNNRNTTPSSASSLVPSVSSTRPSA